MTSLKSLPKRRKPPLQRPSKPASNESIPNRLQAVRSVTGLLDDLSADQIEKFDEAVKRRSLFSL